MTISQIKMKNALHEVAIVKYMHGGELYTFEANVGRLCEATKTLRVFVGTWKTLAIEQIKDLRVKSAPKFKVGSLYVFENRMLGPEHKRWGMLYKIIGKGKKLQFVQVGETRDGNFLIDTPEGWKKAAFETEAERLNALKLYEAEAKKFWELTEGQNYQIRLTGGSVNVTCLDCDHDEKVGHLEIYGMLGQPVLRGEAVNVGDYITFDLQSIESPIIRELPEKVEESF